MRKAHAQHAQRAYAPSIEIGSRVKVDLSGEIRTFDIIESAAFDYAHDFITSGSRLGQELIGKQAGDTVVIDTPFHKFSMHVLNVETPAS